jgi:hypothetical protein
MASERALVPHRACEEPQLGATDTCGPGVWIHELLDLGWGFHKPLPNGRHPKVKESDAPKLPSSRARHATQGGSSAPD